MRLTVAMRVIGGFSITAVLLLFLGINSVLVLNDISKSTETVNNLSVPAMESSAALQQRFMAMSKTTLLDYYANSYEEVEQAVAELFEDVEVFIHQDPQSLVEPNS